MTRPSPWRVRVMRKMEVWCDVSATSAADAEEQAITVPGVIHVFEKSAIPVSYTHLDVYKRQGELGC